jgi:hypothetical protein
MLAAIDILLFSAYGSYFTSSPSVVENDRLLRLTLMTSRWFPICCSFIVIRSYYFTTLSTQSTASASTTTARMIFVFRIFVIVGTKVHIFDEIAKAFKEKSPRASQRRGMSFFY